MGGDEGGTWGGGMGMREENGGGGGEGRMGMREELGGERMGNGNEEGT